MTHADWPQINAHILQMEEEGLVTRTFRRLNSERQQAVVLAILEEATDKGPAALNIKHVAERAGVSVGSLYTYFNHREGLIAFAVALCVRYMKDSFELYRPYLLALPLRDALAAYLTGGVAWSQTQTSLIQFFAKAAYQGDEQLTDLVVRPIADAMLQIVRDILAQAAARGEIRADIDLEATARILHALTIAVGDSQLLPYLNHYFQVISDQVLPEQILHMLLEMVQRGIGVTAP